MTIKSTRCHVMVIFILLVVCLASLHMQLSVLILVQLPSKVNFYLIFAYIYLKNVLLSLKKIPKKTYFHKMNDSYILRYIYTNKSFYSTHFRKHHKRADVTYSFIIEICHRMPDTEEYDIVGE